MTAGKGVAGVSLPEVLVVVAIAGVAIGLGAEGFRRLADAVALHGAAGAVRGQIGLARARAVMQRSTVRVGLSPEGEVVVWDPDGRAVSRVALRRGPLALDSARLRPATLRFNQRGQAAPGSVWLYRGRRGVRVVTNFLGRVRRESVPLPDG